MSECKVSVIVAVEYSQLNLPEIIPRIVIPDHTSAEVIIVHTNDIDCLSSLVTGLDNVSSVKVIDGSRIPEMWAAGIRMARGELVALTTAHCIPATDWMRNILALDMPDDVVGTGGIFRNSDSASALDWAVFLQRYRQYVTNGSRRDVKEIAADNAVYRKKEITACHELLARGFWEPEFHTRFRAQGLRLVIDPSLVVIHHNLYTFRQFAGQRIDHGAEFGAARAAAGSALRNFALFLVSPALWLFFLQKIVTESFREKEYRIPTLKALPWLLVFVFCWGYGESKGYYYELVRRLRR